LLKKTHLGVHWLRQTRANALLREFNSFKFKDRESVDEFGIHITDVTNQLTILDNGYIEPEIIHKFL